MTAFQRAATCAAGGPTLDGLKPGDPVRIAAEPPKGYEAIFDLRPSGSERALVLLQMLGRQMRLTVNGNTIERIRRRRGPASAAARGATLPLNS
jgi:hypothetical protein